MREEHNQMAGGSSREGRSHRQVGGNLGAVDGGGDVEVEKVSRPGKGKTAKKTGVAHFTTSH